MRMPRKTTRRWFVALSILVGFTLFVAGFVFVSLVFGLSNALALSLLLLPPLVVTVRLCLRWTPVRGRELAFLAILLCGASGSIVFVAWDWYAAGMARYHDDDVKWTEFERLMRRDPAFRNLKINLTDRKHIYWASGTVSSETDLDRLRSLASRCGIERRLDGPFEQSASLTVEAQDRRGKDR
jgi:hypothetical protein